MNFVRTISTFSAVAGSTMAMSTWAAIDAQHDSHHPATTATVLIAQATPTAPGLSTMGRMGPGARGGKPGDDRNADAKAEAPSPKALDIHAMARPVVRL